MARRTTVDRRPRKAITVPRNKWQYDIIWIPCMATLLTLLAVDTYIQPAIQYSHYECPTNWHYFTNTCFSLHPATTFEKAVDICSRYESVLYTGIFNNSHFVRMLYHQGPIWANIIKHQNVWKHNVNGTPVSDDHIPKQYTSHHLHKHTAEPECCRVNKQGDLETYPCLGKLPFVCYTTPYAPEYVTYFTIVFNHLMQYKQGLVYIFSYFVVLS